MNKLFFCFVFSVLLTLASIQTLIAADCIDPPSGMVAWWAADGNLAEIVAGRSGTLRGSAGFAPGMVQQALRFDGNDWISIQDDPIWTLGTHDFTIDLWVLFNSLTYRDPLIAHNYSDNPENNDKWVFWYDEQGHDKQYGVPALRFHIAAEPGGPVPYGHDTVVAPWNPLLGQWYHVAITRSGTFYALYINGVQVATDTSTFAIPDPAVPLTIARTESYFHNGLVDEVEIFNRALSATEILRIYNAGSAGKCKPARGASTHCDFNNDGYDDLAIGVPGEDLNGVDGAGAVQVMYGRGDGLTATNNQFWNLNSTNVAGDLTKDASFGQALACGDFNGDSLDDLAIGAPGSGVNGVGYTGSVTVLYGTSKWRLSATNSQRWGQDSPNIADRAEGWEQFGDALAAGDFNGDGYDDLAIGAPGESLEYPDYTVSDAGAVHILYGSGAGLTATGSQFWTQDSAGIAEAADVDYDRFGSSLAAGNFGKDSAGACYDDLAIGVPWEDATSTSSNDGVVHVLYGSVSGLTSAESQLWMEGSGGVPETVESDDEFGGSLTAGSFRGIVSACGKNIDDLVIAAPGEVINFKHAAGAVFVLYGTTSGLTSTDVQMWNQDSPSIAETPEQNDRFGLSLATGSTSTGSKYLVIGAPYETVGSMVGSGAIHVLYTDPATNKLTATGSRLFHQSSPGVKDSAEVGDTFGLALATGDFNADGLDDIAVGSPYEELKGLVYLGAIHVLYGADSLFTQFYHQNSVDMKDYEEADDRFGSSFSQSSCR